MTKLVLVKDVLDNCSKTYLTNLFAPIADLPASSTKAEIISHCLNKELGAYGFHSYVAPDKTSVLINDDSMCKIVDFLNKKGYQPNITQEQIKRISVIQKVADDNNVDLFWEQFGLRKKYYYFKQYGFNGLNLYNVINMNSINSAAATLAGNGAATLSMSGVIALSWTASLFLSTLENYIPNTMPVVKASVCGAKFVSAFPIRCVEWTANTLIGSLERVIMGSELPTNITEVHKLNVGPKLKDLVGLKKSILNWLIDKLKKL